MVDLPRPRAILFDWDNTLVDTWPLIHDALLATFGAMSVEPWTFDETKARVKRSMRDAFPGLFGDRWEDAAKVYQGHYMANHLQNLVPLPGALEMLDYLKEQPVALAVVSNKKSVNLRKEAEHLGLSPRFITLIGADDAARDKPHPDPAIMALERLGINAGEDVWFVGDTTIDLECAQQTGCLPVLFGDAMPDDDMTLEGFQIAAHFLTHAQMVDALKRLFS